MRFKLSAVLVVVVLVLGACAASNSGTQPPGTSPDGTTDAATQPVQSVGATAEASNGRAAITIATDTDAALKFDPATVRLTAGTKVQVTFENRATVPHNLTFDAPISVATSTIVAPGTSETIEFTAPAHGDYTFVCTLHPGMGGTVSVDAG